MDSDTNLNMVVEIKILLMLLTGDGVKIDVNYLVSMIGMKRRLYIFGTLLPLLVSRFGYLKHALVVRGNIIMNYERFKKFEDNFG